MSFAFPKKLRLKGYATIQEIFKKGEKKLFFPLAFHFLVCQNTEILIGASKKAGNSVFRNRVKRQIREVVRHSDLMSLKLRCAVILLKKKKLENGCPKYINQANIQQSIDNFISFMNEKKF